MINKLILISLLVISSFVYAPRSQAAGCTVNSLTVSPNPLIVGQTSTISWSSNGCVLVDIAWSYMEGDNLQNLKFQIQTHNNQTANGSVAVPAFNLAGRFAAVFSGSNTSSYDNSDGKYYDGIKVVSASVQNNINTPAPTLASYYGYPPRNVVSPDGTVYLINGLQKQPYTSAAAFLSYSFNSWANVVPMTLGDNALPLLTATPSGKTQEEVFYVAPRNGSLINDHGTIYIITNGLRAGFTSDSVFRGLGYSYANVIDGDTSFMVTLPPINSASRAHPTGTVINQDGTLFFMNAFGEKYGIPNMDIFNSWGLKLSEVVPANSYDRAIGALSNLSLRMTNQFRL